ncbi:hypothetical protein [Negadavirga shengliensis]|uniref:Membrane metalloprotease n=1 Tax=Negadavirga shengliensis TaxID=1389218 RepID=A0ABV9T7P7_9BACT
MNRIVYLFYIIGFSLLFYSCLDDRDKIAHDPFIGKQAARRSVGQSASQILSDERFTRLEVEIVYMEGVRPTNEMINNIRGFLEELIRKPEGVIIQDRAIPGRGQSNYTVQEIREMEEEHRGKYNDGNTITLFVLVLDGHFNNDDEESFALGAAYQNTSIVLFGKRIEENSGGFRRPSRGVLESTVALHELGHLMGLVNVGSDMVVDHEDEEYDSHCDNSECLMYWAVETSGLFNLTGNNIPALDQNCRNDLTANGGR